MDALWNGAEGVTHAEPLGGLLHPGVLLAMEWVALHAEHAFRGREGRLELARPVRPGRSPG